MPHTKSYTLVEKMTRTLTMKKFNYDFMLNSHKKLSIFEIVLN